MRVVNSRSSFGLSEMKSYEQHVHLIRKLLPKFLMLQTKSKHVLLQSKGCYRRSKKRLFIYPDDFYFDERPDISIACADDVHDHGKCGILEDDILN